ncbi:MAG: hypothetical protein KTR13_08925 [Saprospiraceae bacterium]|nr:hypothetical protein [Saprospiraceae bacterium]
MRKKLHWLVFALTCLVMFGCEDETVNAPFASFDKSVSLYTADGANLVVLEGDVNVGIVITRNLVDPSPVTVNYTIEEVSASAGADYEIIAGAGSVTIPSDQASGFILFNTVDNDFGGEDDKIFIVRLTGADSGYVVDESPGRASEVTVVIQDDECVPYLPLSHTAAPMAFGFAAPTYPVVLGNLTCGGAVETYSMDSAWGPNFVGWATGDPGFNGAFPYSAVLSVDTATNAVTITGNDAWATGGSGTYDPMTGQISYTVSQALFTTDFTVDNVLTPN